MKYGGQLGERGGNTQYVRGGKTREKTFPYRTAGIAVF
jgi:hypothetical protein